MSDEFSDYDLTELEASAGYVADNIALTRWEFEKLIATAREYNCLLEEQESIDELKYEIDDLKEMVELLKTEIKDEKERNTDLDNENDKLQGVIDDLVPEIELYRSYFRVMGS